MTIIKKIIFGIMTVFLVGNLSSCVNIKPTQPKQVQRQYLFLMATPKNANKNHSEKTLEIGNVYVAPQFSAYSFIYRLDDINYTTDYYNLFFISPAQQVDQIIISYMRAKNLFKYVAYDASLLEANYVLSPEILELYADYRDKQHPKAVLSMHFTLINKNGSNIILNKTYTENVELKCKDSISLVYAWSKDLDMILGDLSRDLALQLSAIPAKEGIHKDTRHIESQDLQI